MQDELMSNSISTEAIDILGKSKFTFTLSLSIKGTKSIQFAPIAKNSNVELKSPWLSPSFIGSNLPQSYDITDEGFNAKWTSNQYSRSYPHYWFNGYYNFKNIKNAFGVNLIEPVDGYAKNSRSSKYSLLVISLTFAVFFFFEIMYKKNIHPIQYIMIGFSLATFYLLLISLTEHIGFDKAYFGSAFATILLIVSYTQFIIKSKKAVGILLVLLGALFSYIFIILQLEEFALLAGSIGLFVILSMVMFLSRNIDWYNLQKG
jgi:inner membrane protein